ncbi:peptide-methionine (S)-S-oxide reductase MsrA [Methylobrevis albus]|uniref:Peptide methionine sulfoxide reductase MsrA n=1 Tax=Methylobrevis albus TaxID=2793297 RepID=A0A931N0P2_9HYPH|nr:peptide-methionine (S)-S-oxide reductase MsrA [Methylobrevis albus]MBH0238991.1 peptide-methionine (S)-S-oxide reductase MsrA [Methylobrevis albus]
MKRMLERAALAAVLVAGVAAAPGPASADTAVFAGGCFWCVETDFDKVPGVTATTSGYIGGAAETATYEQVSAGGTGHYEAVQIEYDPARVSYETLVDVFVHSVDATDAGGQFCDRGESYRTAVFVNGAAERKTAEAVLAAAGASIGKTLVTPVLDATPFYAAEDYHQNYGEKNPVRYRYYRYSCGRDAQVQAIWGADARRGIPGS